MNFADRAFTERPEHAQAFQFERGQIENGMARTATVMWWCHLVHILAGSKSLYGSMCVVQPAAKEVAEKCGFRPSGVKTPDESADIMSCLKARPTKLNTFSATSKAGLILDILCRG